MGDRIIKLALWNTRNFRPVMSHKELEPIMARLGFSPVKTNLCNAMADDGTKILWKEYYYSRFSSNKRSCDDPPRPKLPYPVIDGLHICTYEAFLDSINFYLGPNDDLSDIIHIRGMTLNKLQDTRAKWSHMEERDNGKINVYVYREELYDISVYNANKTHVNCCGKKNKGYNLNIFRKGNNTLAGCKFVPMEAVVVQRLSDPKSKKYKVGEQYTSGD